LGTVALGAWLGERLLGARGSADRTPVLPAIVGVLVLSGVESIPCIGGMIAVVAGCLGLGAALLSRFGAQHTGRSALHLPLDRMGLWPVRPTRGDTP
jgi:hypothetical protein